MSGLLYCSVCEQKLYRQAHGSTKNGRWRVLTCNNTGPSHLILPYEDAVKLIANEIAKGLQKRQASKNKETEEDQVTYYQKAMDDLAKRRKRVQEGFESGIYDDLEAKTKLNQIQSQIENIQQEIKESQQAAQIRAEFTKQVQDLTNFSTWILEDDPTVVHRLLTALCEKITITPENEIKISWHI